MKISCTDNGLSIIIDAEDMVKYMHIFNTKKRYIAFCSDGADGCIDIMMSDNGVKFVKKGKKKRTYTLRFALSKVHGLDPDYRMMNAQTVETKYATNGAFRMKLPVDPHVELAEAKRIDDMKAAGYTEGPSEKEISDFEYVHEAAKRSASKPVLSWRIIAAATLIYIAGSALIYFT